MKKILIPLLLLFVIALSCNSESNKKEAEKQRLDSIRIADSVNSAQQLRIIDSISLVNREQQIIADSIEALVNN